MMGYNYYNNMLGWTGVPWMQNNFFWFIPFVVLDLILKGIALWKAGRNSQPAWFIILLIVNSLGILPAVYLLFFQKKKKPG